MHLRVKCDRKQLAEAVSFYIGQRSLKFGNLDKNCIFVQKPNLQNKLNDI